MRGRKKTPDLVLTVTVEVTVEVHVEVRFHLALLRSSRAQARPALNRPTFRCGFVLLAPDLRQTCVVQIATVSGASEQERKSYYEGAIRALQFVEGRRATGRRFGPDADARWKSFKGDLQTADRIDLLIRDADAEWPCAFGARAVYDLQAVAEDEAFGSEWQPLDPVIAEEMWRGITSEQTSEPSPESPAKILGALAKAWSIELTAVDIGTIAPTDSFVLAGPSAIAASIVAFAEGQGLDWHQQVRVIATPPGHRQLAVSGVAIVNAAKATQLFSETAAAELKPMPGARLITSPDATAADLTCAQRLTTPSLTTPR